MGQRSVTVAGIAGAGSLAFGLGGQKVIEQLPDWFSIGLSVIGASLLLTALFLHFVKRRSGDEGGSIQASYGTHSPNLSGTFHGPVSIGPPPPAATQPERSPYGSAKYDIEKLNDGLERVMRGLSDREARETQVPRDAAAHFFRTGRDLPKPNLPLAGVLTRVYAKLGPAPRGEARAAFDDQVDCEIADAVKFNRLHVWGRSQAGRALEEITLDLWENGKFDHKAQRFSYYPAYSNVCYLTDLRFDKAEVDEVWPKPLRTTNDGKP